MASPLTNVRIATSLVTHEGGSTATEQEIDFELATQEAIEIFAVLGVPTSLENFTSTGATIQAPSGIQTLHLEDDNPRDVGFEISATDVVFLDDEVIYEQSVMALELEDDTNGVGVGGLAVTPNQLIVFPQPVLSARNLTHSVVTSTTNIDFVGQLFIHYRYVRLTQTELAFAIASRR